MAGLDAIENIKRHIELFRSLHDAGGDQFRSAARLVENMAPPAVSDGVILCAIALAGRNLVKQLVHAHDSTKPALRQALLSISEAMDAEFHAGPDHKSEIPWHLRNN